MKFPNQRDDQFGVIITDPIQHVRHYTVAEIRGVIVNFSSEELYVGSIGFGGTGNVRGKANPHIPKTLPAHSSTGEILLLTVEINIDDFDPIENMKVCDFHFDYADSSGGRYRIPRALFQLILQQ